MKNPQIKIKNVPYFFQIDIQRNVMVKKPQNVVKISGF